MAKYFFPELCKECGGTGLLDYGPINHGGPNISDTCYNCKGKYQEQYWTLVVFKRNLERQEDEDGNHKLEERQ